MKQVLIPKANFKLITWEFPGTPKWKSQWKKVRKVRYLYFWSTTETVINNSQSKIQKQGDLASSGGRKFPLLGAQIGLPAWWAFQASRPGRRIGKTGADNCASIIPIPSLRDFRLLIVFIHQHSRSTYCMQGPVPMLRVKDEMLQAQPSRSSKSGGTTPSGLSALPGRCGVLLGILRRGSSSCPGRLGSPPREDKSRDWSDEGRAEVCVSMFQLSILENGLWFCNRLFVWTGSK